MGLSDGLSNPDKKAVVVDDFCSMIELQVASRSGISGMALKASFGALKGVKPGYINYIVEQILPQCFTALDPIWDEGLQTGDPVGYLNANRDRTADALLGVTDTRAETAKNQLVKGIYSKVRGSAKQNVEEAVPELANIIDKYTKT